MVGVGSSSSSNKAPSRIIPLPPNFEPTPEEQSLLDLYQTVKQYEKEAAKLKEKGARDRLRLADEQFKQQQKQQQQQQDVQEEQEGVNPAEEDNGTAMEVTKDKKKKKKKIKKREDMADDESVNASDDDMSDHPSSASDDDDDDDDEPSSFFSPKKQKSPKKKKPQQAQQQQEDQKTAAQREEEERMNYLKQDEDEMVEGVFTQPALKKKRGMMMGDDEYGDEKNAGPSLISNIGHVKTPPHEFSKKLNMGKASLSGKVLFPSSNDITPGTIPSWEPPPYADNPSDGALELELPHFHSSKASVGSGNNTLAIKFSVPEESRRFSFNIAGPNHSDYHNILFHFNPRQRQKGGQVVINDKQEGIWGQGINVPLSQIPVVFGKVSCTLLVQITGDGFDVFIGDELKHCARLDHRTTLPSEDCSLHFQVPSTDDYGSLESWTVYRVWWGNKELMASGDLSGVAGVNQYSSLHPRKLFISKLKKIHTEPEVDLRRAELERAFRKYGGAHGAQVIVPTNSTFAFVELETERQADLALQEMSSIYRLNRARRTKHEALQEERAAAEKAKSAATGVGGKRKAEASEWD